MKTVEDFLFRNIRLYIATHNELNPKGLAKYLAKNRYNLYRIMEHDSVGESVDYMTGTIGIELNAQEREAVINKYMTSDTYAKTDLTSLWWHILQVKKQSEKEK